MNDAGMFTCSNPGCDKTFTTLYSAGIHSKTLSCSFFTGESEKVACPNNCGRKFTRIENAKTHAKSKQCPENPERKNDPNYKSALRHTIIDGKKPCSSCKQILSTDNFGKEGTAYGCHTCTAIHGMSSSVRKKARDENHPEEAIPTVEDIRSLYTENCPIFGIKLQYGGADTQDFSATCDAYDHSKGHCKGNLRIISRKANTIKNNANYQEMETLLTALKNWSMPHPTTITNTIPNKESLKGMFKRAKNRSKQKGVPCTITEQYIYILGSSIEHCPISGNKLQYGGGKKCDNSASLDRYIPHLGYTPENVWIISDKMNRMKSDATIEEIERVLTYMSDLKPAP